MRSEHDQLIVLVLILLKHLSVFFFLFFFKSGSRFKQTLLICVSGGSCSSTTDFVMYLHVIGLNKQFLKQIFCLLCRLVLIWEGKSLTLLPETN